MFTRAGRHGAHGRRAAPGTESRRDDRSAQVRIVASSTTGAAGLAFEGEPGPPSVEPMLRPVAARKATVPNTMTPKRNVQGF